MFTGDVDTHLVRRKRSPGADVGAACPLDTCRRAGYLCRAFRATSSCLAAVTQSDLVQDSEDLLANVASAEKRNRQRLKRRARNMHHLSTTRTAVKKATAAIEGKDPKGSAEVIADAVRQLDKAASKGVIKRGTASRKISRLTLALAKKTAAAKA